jgi:glycosyltransferase involved in cell wall biosynthesis
MDFVSIIIPSYNRGHIIERGIQSVLEQTHQDIEIIVVDDNSQDNTADIVTNLIQKDSRIQYLYHNKQKGAQASRNIGIRAAKGKWIAFLDSDDYWLPDSLEKRLKVIHKLGVKVVHSECNTIDVNGVIKPFGIPALSGYIYAELLKYPSPMFQGLLVEKEALKKINYLDEKIITYQEWDTSIRLAKYYPFGFVPQPTFVYDCQGKDTMSKNMLRDVEGYKQVFNKHFFEIFKLFNPRIIAQHYSMISSRYSSLGNYSAAYYYRFISLLWWPFYLSNNAINFIKNQLKRFP